MVWMKLSIFYWAHFQIKFLQCKMRYCFKLQGRKSKEAWLCAEPAKIYKGHIVIPLYLWKLVNQIKCYKTWYFHPSCVRRVLKDIKFPCALSKTLYVIADGFDASHRRCCTKVMGKAHVLYIKWRNNWRLYSVKYKCYWKCILVKQQLSFFETDYLNEYH